MAKPRRRWMAEHQGDPFVQQAQAQGYRSRAAFKLLELDRRFRLLAVGQTVVDLGAAPGAWSQVAARRVGRRGRVVAVDRLPMAPVEGVTVIEGDMEQPSVRERLRAALQGQPADLVMSDMAPNISGIRAADQARAIGLAELALEVCQEILVPDGALVVKVFQGSGYEDFLGEMRQSFRKVRVGKPRASRAASREVYLVAQGVQLVHCHQSGVLSS